VIMDPEPNEFEKLKALLALKRHEQPPPGYFDNFASKVVSRIQAGETAAQASWWRRWIRPLQASPALACAYGLAVVGLLVLGLNLAPRLDQQAGDGPGSDQWSAGALPMPQAPQEPLPESIFPSMADPLPALASGTNPPGVLASNSPFSLEQWRPQMRVEPAGFQPANR